MAHTALLSTLLLAKMFASNSILHPNHMLVTVLSCYGDNSLNFYCTLRLVQPLPEQCSKNLETERYSRKSMIAIMPIGCFCSSVRVSACACGGHGSKKVRLQYIPPDFATAEITNEAPYKVAVSQTSGKLMWRSVQVCKSKGLYTAK